MEIVHKQVGGCLIPYNLQLVNLLVYRTADASKMDEFSEKIQTAFDIAGIELLGQLKGHIMNDINIKETVNHIQT